jgi:phage terminase large subunit-like protein
LWAKDRAGREAWLRSLNADVLRQLYCFPDIFLFDKQVVPDDIAWRYYLLRCGRSFGKTHAGAAWVAKKIRQGAAIVGLCGPTYDDVAKVMVPAILKWFTPDELCDPPYSHGSHTVSFKSEQCIYCYTSDKEIRGPNLDYLWCDEICVWADGMPDKIKERFDDIDRTVRVGLHPQVLITSTPKNHPFFTAFQEEIDKCNPLYRLVIGSTFDNPTLPQAYLDAQRAKCTNSVRDRMELYGDLILDTEGAFWTHETIDKHKKDVPHPINETPLIYTYSTVPNNEQLMGRAPMPTPLTKEQKVHLIRVVIGFDPAGSIQGDECGIIVGALYSDNHVYVVEDASGSYCPQDYAMKINQLYMGYGASCVVVESNFGGKESFRYILRSVNANMVVKTVHAHVGKSTRAEHISALYSQGRVHHPATVLLKDLEEQMCKFNVHYSKSPDRVDALGYCVTELFFPQEASVTFTAKNFPTR